MPVGIRSHRSGWVGLRFNLARLGDKRRKCRLFGLEEDIQLVLFISYKRSSPFAGLTSLMDGHCCSTSSKTLLSNSRRSDHQHSIHARVGAIHPPWILSLSCTRPRSFRLIASLAQTSRIWPRHLVMRPVDRKVWSKQSRAERFAE
jgi:hypothetical protein